MGLLYLVLSLNFLPAINASHFTRVLTGWTASAQSTEFKAMVDWMWTFGLDLLAIGLVAFVVGAVGGIAALPVIAWVIIARELTGGILADIRQVTRGYANRRVYAAFIALHVVIIASGLLLLVQ